MFYPFFLFYLSLSLFYYYYIFFLFCFSTLGSFSVMILLFFHPFPPAHFKSFLSSFWRSYDYYYYYSFSFIFFSFSSPASQRRLTMVRLLLTTIYVWFIFSSHYGMAGFTSNSCVRTCSCPGRIITSSSPVAPPLRREPRFAVVPDLLPISLRPAALLDGAAVAAESLRIRGILISITIGRQIYFDLSSPLLNVQRSE